MRLSVVLFIFLVFKVCFLGGGIYGLSFYQVWKFLFFLIFFFSFYFNWRLIILQYCGGFAIHSHESAMGIHVFPI